MSSWLINSEPPGRPGPLFVVSAPVLFSAPEADWSWESLLSLSLIALTISSVGLDWYSLMNSLHSWFEMIFSFEHCQLLSILLIMTASILPLLPCGPVPMAPACPDAPWRDRSSPCLAKFLSLSCFLTLESSFAPLNDERYLACWLCRIFWCLCYF